eukprot:529323_1
MEAFKSILLKNNAVNNHNITSLLHYLKQNTYDTDAVIEDILHTHHTRSFVFQFCQNTLSNKSLFDELKCIVGNYVKYHYSESFKDMDYAISKYYELMGVDTKDGYYFSKYGIGKFERYCYSLNHSCHVYYYYIKEKELDTHCKRFKPYETPISLFDFQTFPLLQNTDKRTKRKKIHTILKNCYENKHWYDNTHNYLKQFQDISCKSVVSCPAVQN